MSLVIEKESVDLPGGRRGVKVLSNNFKSRKHN